MNEKSENNETGSSRHRIENAGPVMSGVSPAVIEQVKAAATSDLTDLAEQAGYRWPASSHRRGQKLHCAGHRDRTASVHVYDDRIHCFGCGRSLDAIDLEQIVGGGTFNEALRRLAARYGIGTNRVKVSSRPLFDSATLAEVQLFKVALSWRIEAELKIAKAPLLESPGEIDGEHIFALTQMLAQVQGWSAYEAAEAFIYLKTKQPDFVAGLVAEANEWQTMWTHVIYFAGQAKEVFA